MVDDLVEMQLSCDNKTARAMVLNYSVELNRKSSGDKQAVLWLGYNARVLSVWREIDVEMMLLKMRVLYKRGIE